MGLMADVLFDIKNYVDGIKEKCEKSLNILRDPQKSKEARSFVTKTFHEIKDTAISYSRHIDDVGESVEDYRPTHRIDRGHLDALVRDLVTTGQKKRVVEILKVVFGVNNLLELKNEDVGLAYSIFCVVKKGVKI